jgi:hypothetical protein
LIKYMLLILALSISAGNAREGSSVFLNDDISSQGTKTTMRGSKKIQGSESSQVSWGAHLHTTDPEGLRRTAQTEIIKHTLGYLPREPLLPG